MLIRLSMSPNWCAMSKRMLVVLRAVILIALFPVVGCSSESGPPMLPVEGKVMVDNAPLAKGYVRFQPDTTKGNTFGSEPVGEVGSDGTYKLMLNGKPGAPAGWYKVGVTASSTDIPDSSKPFADKSPVANRFGDPSKSGLTIQVEATAPAGGYNLKVSAK